VHLALQQDYQLNFRRHLYLQHRLPLRLLHRQRRAIADEAIAVLERRSDIHTIITDINMPGSMDGLRLAAAVRDRWPPIKIIVVTGHKPPELDELPSDSLFVAKPYTAERMIAAVNELQ